MQSIPMTHQRRFLLVGGILRMKRNLTVPCDDVSSMVWPGCLFTPVVRWLDRVRGIMLSAQSGKASTIAVKYLR